MSDANDLERLIDVQNEMEAAAIVNELQEAGIRAVADGDFTAGFRAEAPGSVHVRVRQADLGKAQELLKMLRTPSEPVDWNEVDVGKPEDAG